MMTRLAKRLWNDDAGALIAMEFLFVATILVLGIITGLVGVRNAVATELTELGNAILALSQGYTIQGLTGCCSATDGSATTDTFTPLTPPTCTPVAPSPIDVLPCG